MPDTACGKFPSFLGLNSISVMYMLHFRQPYIHGWTFVLFLSLGYCEQYGYEHGCVSITSRPYFKFFWIYFQKWDCQIIQNFNFQFFEGFPSSLHHFTIPPTVHRGSISPHLQQHFFFSVSLHFFFIIVRDARWYLTVLLICISLMNSGTEHLSICFWLLYSIFDLPPVLNSFSPLSLHLVYLYIFF